MIVTIEVAVAVAVDDEKEEDLLDYLDVVLVVNEQVPPLLWIDCYHWNDCYYSKVCYDEWDRPDGGDDDDDVPVRRLSLFLDGSSCSATDLRNK